MTYSLFDVVLLVCDVPDDNLKAGMKGVVIDIYAEPTPAYEVEFCDANGRTIAQLALPPEMLQMGVQGQGKLEPR